MDPQSQQTLPGYQPGNYSLLTGKAVHPSEIAPRAITLSGTLAAPFDFLVGRPTLAAQPETIRLEIDNQSGKLTLHLLDTDPFTHHVITGSLSENKELDSFRINSDSRWNVRELIKFLRTVKVHFADRTEVEALIGSLQKWTASIETVIKEHNDNSGNSLSMLEKKVSGVALKNKFTLLIQIYKGYEKIKFDVEICVEPKNNEVLLYLISDELYEQKFIQRQSIMMSELAKFDKHKFSKVVVS